MATSSGDLGISRPFTDLIGGWSVNMQHLEAELKDYVALGVSTVRVDFYWDWVQKSANGTFDWSIYDTAINKAAEYGIEITGILQSYSAWNSTGSLSTTQDIANYAKFAAAAAEHFNGRVDTWEIINEVNMGVMSPENYTKVLQAAYAAIKNVDPTDLVISSGLAPAPSNTGNMIGANEFLQRMYAAGAKGSFDAVGFHPYTFPLLPDDPAPWNGWQIMETDIRGTMLANGDGAKQVWITELGAPTNGSNAAVSQEFQAQILQQAVAFKQAYSWIGGPILWYSYQDKGISTTDIESWFGLVGPNGEKKAAYWAYQELGTVDVVVTPEQPPVVPELAVDPEQPRTNNVHGTERADTLNGTAGNDTMFGHSGDDVISAQAGNDTVYGGYGIDIIYAGSGNDTIYAESEDDQVFGDTGDDLIYAGGGNDMVRAGSNNDVIDGGDGNDRIWGDDGEDNIDGGAGDDTIYGGIENDNIRGGAGKDLIDGEWGNDTLNGGEGDDTIYGGTGNDVIAGESGNDTLDGGEGNDVVRAGDGNDIIRGGEGDDTLYGDSNNDEIHGGNGNDVIRGGLHDDALYGGNGDDQIFGEDGNDIIYGGAGSDTLSGGSGADRFVFDISNLSSSIDTIIDFQKGDVIDLSQLDAKSTQRGNQSFTFIGNAWLDNPGDLGFYQDKASGVTHVQGDLNGDNKYDFDIVLKGVLELTKGDFIL